MKREMAGLIHKHQTGPRISLFAGVIVEGQIMGIGEDKKEEAGETFGKAFGRGQGDYRRLCATGGASIGLEHPWNASSTSKATSILL
jgi:hypothetical protein